MEKLNFVKFEDVFTLKDESVYENLQLREEKELETSDLLKFLMTSVIALDPKIKIFTGRFYNEKLYVEIGYKDIRNILVFSNNEDYFNITSYSQCFSLPLNIETDLYIFEYNTYSSLFTYIIVEGASEKYLMTKFSIDITDELDSYLFAYTFIDQLQNSYIKIGSAMTTLLNREEIFADQNLDYECLFNFQRLSGDVENTASSYLLELLEKNEKNEENPSAKFRLSLEAFGRNLPNAYSIADNSNDGVDFPTKYSEKFKFPGSEDLISLPGLGIELDDLKLYCTTAISNPIVGTGLLVIIYEKKSEEFNFDKTGVTFINNLNSSNNFLFNYGNFSLNPYNDKIVLYTLFIPSFYGQLYPIENIITKITSKKFTDSVSESFKALKELSKTK